MDNTNMVYSRSQQKIDTEANWLKAVNFTPLKGEIIIYSKDDNYDYDRIKIGDGETKVNDLKFVMHKIDIPNFYVQSTEPTDAAIGALWIDTSTDNSLSYVEEVLF